MPDTDTTPVEFDCAECGRHIRSIGYHPPGMMTCGACTVMPGWYLDPELRRRIDPDFDVKE